ncbi:MAG: GGDEF domain-containing protein [Gammaproteobacteria bacterium HGW-Gammaproteobacteria-13]|uniref:GGDEF domain-containing protein n=1 Tax=Pseudomonas sp. 1928-m TaxID=3033804 RepID=UPI000CC64A30|nr:GGDEF domain-containing protein [Pseudomonas sp. 1928-m]MDF3194215.1 GGDEF domain-containing protein [Pseudomonas sp. 1928-m]PKM25234.1 MAG: GGDEF domain-containing protein [Gammaproteobacteria bacterium HGW-Gammaproteobacteria-13]
MRAWRIDWQTIAEKNRAFAPQLLEQNIRRLRLAAPWIPPLNLMHIWLFWQRQPESANEALWRQGILAAHTGMLVFFGALALAAWYLASRPELVRLRQISVNVAVLGTLCFAALISAIDQLVTSNITPLLVGCSLTALVFLHRPLSALWLFSLTLALFLFGIQQTQSTPAVLLSNQVNGLSSCSIGLLLAWLQWSNFVQINTQKQRLQDQAQLLEEQNHKLSYLAEHDPLSGLLNRRAFNGIVERELLRCQRTQQPLCLLLLDLDHFKTVNDRFGHPLGDVVIKRIAALLSSQVRGLDSLARLGGEEFMLLLVNCDREQGLQIAEKLRQLVETQLQEVDGKDVAVTVSIGMSYLDAGQSGTYDSLYVASDRALYSAKQDGRNRVKVAAPS